MEGIIEFSRSFIEWRRSFLSYNILSTVVEIILICSMVGCDGDEYEGYMVGMVLMWW
jgi:hypothetical protein